MEGVSGGGGGGSKGKKVLPTYRRGKWTAEEEAYSSRLISEFKLGLLPLTDGTTLRTFLSKLLNCDPMRISKKFVGQNCIGKVGCVSCTLFPSSAPPRSLAAPPPPPRPRPLQQVFRRRQQDIDRQTPEELEAKKKEIAALEKRFLERVAQTNRAQRNERNGVLLNKGCRLGSFVSEDGTAPPWMVPPSDASQATSSLGIGAGAGVAPAAAASAAAASAVTSSTVPMASIASASGGGLMLAAAAAPSAAPQFALPRGGSALTNALTSSGFVGRPFSDISRPLHLPQPPSSLGGQNSSGLGIPDLPQSLGGVGSSGPNDWNFYQSASSSSSSSTSLSHHQSSNFGFGEQFYYDQAGLGGGVGGGGVGGGVGGGGGGVGGGGGSSSGGMYRVSSLDLLRAALNEHESAAENDEPLAAPIQQQQQQYQQLQQLEDDQGATTASSKSRSSSPSVVRQKAKHDGRNAETSSNDGSILSSSESATGSYSSSSSSMGNARTLTQPHLDIHQPKDALAVPAPFGVPSAGQTLPKRNSSVENFW